MRSAIRLCALWAVVCLFGVRLGSWQPPADRPVQAVTPPRIPELTFNPTFEVVSIKPSDSLATGGGMRTTGGIFATNMPMRSLIQIAYNLRTGVELIGGPDWLADRYNVNARAEGNPSITEIRQMMQAMLAERINLVVHHETRLLPGFILETVRDDRLGPKMRRREVDCQTARTAALAGRPTPGYVPCSLSLNQGRFVGRGASMSVLTIELTGASGALVEDRTGLAGDFDVELEWAPTLDTVPAADGPPNLFTAVQDQLGLRLRAERISTPVVVIDRVDRPKPD
jgi:uncharacterized protein (TIGR03435 family)